VQSIFRFLFKYPPLMFQQGDFSLGLSRPVLQAAPLRPPISAASGVAYPSAKPVEEPVPR